jgi:hypothetical protein
MADYTKLPFSDIRNYMWNQLTSASVLSETDYWVESFSSYLNPIIPSQQVPEFQNFVPDQPYIVYDIENTGYDSQFWICTDTATLTLIGKKYSELWSMLEVIKDVFRRFDISAREVNKYSYGSPFNFHYIYVDSITSPEYGNEEGGYLYATIKLSYEYTRNINSNYRYT